MKKKNKKKKQATRAPILAAGGIVTRGQARPLFAVVRLRRQKSWVLPKGKLNRNETALAAARREAIEETGHDMQVREFLGSLAYKTSARRKIVRFWRMEASGRPVGKLMKDVSAVRWLPLSRAVGKLTHEREKEFLARVGPHALTSLRRKRTVRRLHRKAVKVRRPARKVPVRTVVGAVRPLRRPDRPASARLAPAAPFASVPRRATAPKQLMQSLWRWLGR